MKLDKNTLVAALAALRDDEIKKAVTIIQLLKSSDVFLQSSLLDQLDEAIEKSEKFQEYMEESQ